MKEKKGRNEDRNRRENASCINGRISCFPPKKRDFVFLFLFGTNRKIVIPVPASATVRFGFLDTFPVAIQYLSLIFQMLVGEH